MKSSRPQNIVKLQDEWKIYSYGDQTDKRKLTWRQESGGREGASFSKLNIGREITVSMTLSHVTSDVQYGEWMSNSLSSAKFEIFNDLDSFIT